MYKNMMEFCTKDDVDFSCETFAARDLYCWSSVVVCEYEAYVHCKCLGHSSSGGGNTKEIQYADKGHGLVRSNAESTFMSVKKEVVELKGPFPSNGYALTIGFVAPETTTTSASVSDPTSMSGYQETLPQHQRLRDWVIAYYWSQTKYHMTGFEIYTQCARIRVKRAGYIVHWHFERRSYVGIRPEGGEWIESHRHIHWIEPGVYLLEFKADVILFAHCSSKDIQDYAIALELDGFPTPSSARITGLDQSLSAFGLERYRLFSMYKQGKETAPYIILLLHGASHIGIDAFGSEPMPLYAPDTLESSNSLMQDLVALSNPVKEKRMMTDSEVLKLQPRFLLPLLGGVFSGDKVPSAFQVPFPAHRLKWRNVAYRLTLGLRPCDPDKPLPGGMCLTLQVYELAGDAASRPSQRVLELRDVEGKDKPTRLITLFFNHGHSSGSASDPTVAEQRAGVIDSRVDFGFINVSGEEVRSNPVLTGKGYRYGAAELSELHRRTGIPIDKFNEASGFLQYYRLQGGLLQKRIFLKSVGGFDWVTVIPEGDWKTLEMSGTKRRLSLRRYIILIFH